MQLRHLLLLLIAALLISSVAVAGTTGKVAGKITDEQTGEPLPGANIVIEGTTMGAASDLNGYYVILNVPPGTYTLHVTMMGYAKATVQNVRVNIDLTTNVNIIMKPTVLTGEEVVVLAERPIVQKDVAASQKNITSANIEELPMATVTDVLGLHAGIGSGLSIRGSGSSEALFMVDGVILRDERNNTPITQIPLSAIREVSVQTGGFGAEYTNVRSGIVNVVTREGETDRYSATVTYRHRPPAPKHFGISPYDPNSYWLRRYLDPAVAWTGTENGAWDEYMRRQYGDFEGWNAVSERTLSDDDPNNDLTPEGAQRVFLWQHRKQGDIKKPDFNIDAALDGPVPFIGKKLGNLRFLAAYREERDMYLMQLSKEALTNYTAMLKLTSNITPAMKLTLMGLYGETEGTALSRSGGTAMMNDVFDVAGATNRAGFTVPWRIFTNIYWAPAQRFYHTLSAKFTHVLSPSTFYDVTLKRVGKKYYTWHGRFRKPIEEKSFEIFPGYIVDEAPYGFEEKPVFGIDGIGMGGPVSTSRDTSEIVTYSAKFDFTSQVNQHNQIKTGLEVVVDDLDMHFGMENKFLPEGNNWSEIVRKPYRGTFYLQDKLEYEGFISILGLITEFTNPNGNWFDVDPYSREFYSQNFEPEQEADFLTKATEARWTLSPRLAISHPITEFSKLYFNYGHYRQTPTSERQYRVQRALNNQLDFIGDPLLPLAKTVSYELGYEHALFNTYLLHLAGYYKDITDQEFWVRFISFDGKVNYRRLTNNSYEDIRGLEIELTKMRGDWITGNVNYEYRVGTSGFFGAALQYENPAEQRDYLRRNPQQFKPRPRPRIKSTLSLHTPSTFGPEVMGRKILAGWNFNFITRWTAGSWFTWNPNNIPGIESNVRWTNFFNVDLKASKVFRFGNANLSFFLDIFNLLNIKNFSGLSFRDSFDYDYYMKSLHLPPDIADPLGYGNIPGSDKPGDYRDDDVEYQPMEWIPTTETISNPNSRAIYYDASTKKYMQYTDGAWSEVSSSRIDKILETKAYIDMPNHEFFTFLNPRTVFFGLTMSYEF